MRIKKFSFITTNWALEEITFDEQNLLVGLNASGKSRTMSALTDIISMITDNGILAMDFSSMISIEDENDEILEYSIQVKDKIITSEKISVGSTVYLNRTKEETSLVNQSPTDLSQEKNETIYPPLNKPTMHVRRDMVAYPYFERLIGWANSSYFIKFGNINNNTLTPDFKIHNIKSSSSDDIAGGLSLFGVFNGLSQPAKSEVIGHLNQMGFNVKDIVGEPRVYQSKVLNVEEEGVGLVDSQQLSQGFYRSLYLLILLSYTKEKKPTSTLMIDDLCEGLDYQRSIELGKIVLSFCEENDIQLIISSNDGFLMDIINLKYWNVIRRDGKNVYSLNYHNSGKEFDEFKFTGLSNLDFFTSDYLSNEKKK